MVNECQGSNSENITSTDPSLKAQTNWTLWSTNRCTWCFWVKRIQDDSNIEPYPFPKGYDFKLCRQKWKLLNFNQKCHECEGKLISKISRHVMRVSIKNVLWYTGFSYGCSNEVIYPSLRGDNLRGLTVMLFPKEAKRYKYIAYGESQFALNKKKQFSD